MKSKLPSIPFRAIVRGVETTITDRVLYGLTYLYRTTGMGLVTAAAITPIAGAGFGRRSADPLSQYDAEKERPSFETRPRKKMFSVEAESSSSSGRFSGPRAFWKARTDRTRRWLADALKDGPRPAGEILRQAKTDGVPERSLRRAKKRLGVKAIKRGGRNGRDGAVWFWQQQQ